MQLSTTVAAVALAAGTAVHASPMMLPDGFPGSHGSISAAHAKAKYLKQLEDAKGKAKVNEVPPTLRKLQPGESFNRRVQRDLLRQYFQYSGRGLNEHLKSYEMLEDFKKESPDLYHKFQELEEATPSSAWQKLTSFLPNLKFW